MPLDPDFLKFLASLGVGGIIAGLIFMWYRKDVRTFTDQWKGQSEMLMTVVKENTTAITANTELTRAIHQELNENRDLRRRGMIQSRADDDDYPRRSR